jgi:DUF1680 family protein
VPGYIAGRRGDGNLVVWQYVPGQYATRVGKGGGQPVQLLIRTPFPREGTADVTVQFPEKPRRTPRFALQLRVPEWCSDYQARVGTQTFRGKAGELLTIDRPWQSGDQVQIMCSMDLRVDPDPNKGSERVSVQRGPQVLAEDDKLDTVNALPGGWAGDQFYRLEGQVNGKKKLLRLVPFADAGQTGGHYQVLLEKITGLQYAK